MLAKPKFPGDLAITHAFRHETDHDLFTRREQRKRSFFGLHCLRRITAERLQDVFQLPVVGPDLPFGDALNAFIKQFDFRFRTSEDSPGAGTKGVPNQLRFASIQEHNNGHIGKLCPNFMQPGEPGKRPVLQVSTYQDDVRLGRLQRRQQVAVFDHGRDYFKLRLTLQCF